MGGILESVFGSWGAVIVQFLVTIVVVLGLIAVVYWLVRRYSAGGLGRIGRGRVPRLALVDAMAVDGRRRLVLVRRDNVEHLIMIGGPADLVVEAGIQRPRRPKTAGQGDETQLAEPPSPLDAADPVRPEPLRPEPLRPEPGRAAAPARPTPERVATAAPMPAPKLEPHTPFVAASAPEAVPVPPPAYNGAANGANGSAYNGHANGAGNGAHPNGADRAFTFRRATPAAPPPVTPPSAAPSAPMRGPMQPLPSPARVMDFDGPTRIEQPVRAPVRDNGYRAEELADTEADDRDLPPEDELPSFLTQTTTMDVSAGSRGYEDEQPRGPAAMNPFARQAPAPARAPVELPQAQHDPETVKRVGDLEREMARLLGEITAKPS